MFRYMLVDERVKCYFIYKNRFKNTSDDLVHIVDNRGVKND